jgi:hypothetical protein
VTGRIIINIEDGISDLEAVGRVQQVIEQGKISNDGQSYCYGTSWSDLVVFTRDPRKGSDTQVFRVARPYPKNTGDAS